MEERKANEECRLAYVWVEGWRERLKRAGGLLEKERFAGKWVEEIKRIDVGWLDEGVGRMGK